jgi:Tripartite tricarboxylate transporter family receptor
MRASLAQNVTIENVAGASGGLGVGRVARVAPDGYLIGLAEAMYSTASVPNRAPQRWQWCVGGHGIGSRIPNVRIPHHRQDDIVSVGVPIAGDPVTSGTRNGNDLT